ncbi:MAG: SMI1/KNR4 family protein [Deltaproteobacteria bacterium]|nr:SMI1/KNR4 family protein [Deltaproteobacteria bacterium]
MANLRLVGPKLSLADIRVFERRLSITLPPSYRKAILRQNGGVPERSLYPDAEDPVASVDVLFELGSKQMHDAIAQLDGCLEAGFLPVAGSSGGDLLLVELRSGRALFWNSESGSDDFHPSELRALENDLGAVLRKLSGEPVAPEPDEVDRLAERGTVEDLQEFLRIHALEAKNSRGLTITQLAARKGNLTLLKACVERGASLDGAMASAAGGHQEAVVLYLLEQGRDINEKRNGRTPLLFAGHAQPEFFEFLLARGAVAEDDSG